MKCATCFLWHPTKNYCSLDGRAHESGCIQNYMPINGKKDHERDD